jgi:hypothetical protein
MDIARSIAVDDNNNAYITGFTREDNFPATSTEYSHNENEGNQEPFVLKLNAAGSDIIYSTLVGGHTSDEANDLFLDDSNNVYVTGFTDSDTFPTTDNAFNQTYNGYRDCFVFKLSADGSDLLYSTYLGGSSTEDEGRGIAVDDEGNVYATGRTECENFPTTSGAYDETYNDDDRADCFVSKLPAENYIPPTTTSPPPTTSSPPTETSPTTTTTTTNESEETSIPFIGYTALITGLSIITVVILVKCIFKRKRK